LVCVGVILVGSLLADAPPAQAATAVSGGGSSFAAIEFQQWTKDVSSPPYNLNVGYNSSSSGQGRSTFAAGTVDYAVTDIRYDKLDDTVIPPSNSFIYLPVTAGGVAFMYNLKAHGFTEANPIKLSSRTICGIFTNAIRKWNDSNIAADNPGVNLPNVPIIPFVRNDAAGTNFVLEEYCIATQPALYAAWAAAASAQSGSYFPDAPISIWPIIPPIVGATGSDSVADNVANSHNDGSITFVETGYAAQRGYPVASVLNDKGAYVQPTPLAVATALSYASQQPDGTHLLNFLPGDPAAYNPSTYSYMLIGIEPGADASKGATLTAFANYCLTIGQQEANSLSYASIGRSLIEFGLARLQVVPGYVAPTAAETAAIPAQQQVTGHATTLSPSGQPQQAAGSSSNKSSTQASTGNAAAPASSASNAASQSGLTGTNNSAAAQSLTAADPAVSLSELLGTLGQSGINGLVLAAIGGGLMVIGEVWRRSIRPRRRGRP
jgi:phosphate transport system substrate-binding protein